MELYHRVLGNGEPLLILHGLFGSSDNWQTLAQRFAEHHTVFLIDLRNHGRSPHAPTHTYPEMAEDLEQFMDAHHIHATSLLGHSMGGKVAMQTALYYSDRIDRLVVVDMAPRAYSGGHEAIFQAMRSLSLEQVQSRKEAEEQLMEQIGDKSIVLFLLKNLARKKGNGFRWKINLDVLYRQYGDLLAGLEEPGSPFDGPTLFLKGEKSDYIRASDEPEINRYFPRAQVAEIPQADHWVHAEQPEAFYERVQEFLES